jgi:hypothetical protein
MELAQSSKVTLENLDDKITGRIQGAENYSEGRCPRLD